MARVRTVVGALGALGALALLVAVAVPADAATGDAPADPAVAISVGGTTVPTAQLVRELKIIAANDRLAKVLAKDDIDLVPRRGTIAPELSGTWANDLVNQIVVDAELARRRLTVSAADRREGRKRAATTFRGKAVFARFPRAFRRVVEEREGRIVALESAFPSRNEPTEDDLRLLFAQSRALCRGDKLLAQIVVKQRAEAGTRSWPSSDRAPTSPRSHGSARSTGRPRLRAASTRVSGRARTRPRVRRSDGRPKRWRSGRRRRR